MGSGQGTVHHKSITIKGTDLKDRIPTAHQYDPKDYWDQLQRGSSTLCSLHTTYVGYVVLSNGVVISRVGTKEYLICMEEFQVLAEQVLIRRKELNL